MERKIIEIDEDKCDGCGLCAEACAEGAIRIVEGKARLVRESYCDGLGACIGECPRGAIAMVEREADPFDEVEAARHLALLDEAGSAEAGRQEGGPGDASALACGCPGSMAREIGAAQEESPGKEERGEAAPSVSRLRNWPVQLKLVPVNAPYLRGADLLLAADCTGFASPSFHRDFLAGKVLLVGCPKLDDAAFYRGKLAQILRENEIRSLTVLFMEVPCCHGLVDLAKQALADWGREIPIRAVKMGVGGKALEELETVGS